MVCAWVADLQGGRSLVHSLPGASKKSSKVRSIDKFFLLILCDIRCGCISEMVQYVECIHRI